MDINIYVTSSLTSSERRISPQWDLGYLKQRLETITGISPADQTLLHYSNSSSDEAKVISDAKNYSPESDRAKTVADLQLAPFSRLHVIDNSGKTDMDIEEDDENAGFVLTEEEYGKRTDSVLHWKKQNQLGRFNPDLQLQKEAERAKNEALVAAMKVGDRCRVISIQGERRGTVRFIGKLQVLDEGENVWVGVEFDEPVGKNNGSIGNTQVFECAAKHGSFLKPKQVEVGDFPPIDPFASDDEL